MSDRANNMIRDQAMRIAQSKDLDLLLAELKGDTSSAILLSVNEYNDVSSQKQQK